MIEVTVGRGKRGRGISYPYTHIADLGASSHVSWIFHIRRLGLRGIHKNMSCISSRGPAAVFVLFIKYGDVYIPRISHIFSGGRGGKGGSMGDVEQAEIALWKSSQTWTRYGNSSINYIMCCAS